jgi:branched-chain amino acid transport system substrate-binding protein
MAYRIIWFALAFLAGIACRAALAADTFDIDVIIPLSGGGAFLGKSQEVSLHATEKVINAEGGLRGKNVRFVFHDDQTSPQVAVQLTNEVAANHPPVIFGSTISAICNAMAPLVQQGPVMYCFSPSIRPAPGGYEFTSQIASRDQQKALMTYFRDKGWTRIALITTTDASGQDAEHAITGLFQEPEFAKMKLVENQHFNPSDVTVSAQIENIRAANPQVIVSWATAAAGGTVFRGLVQAGVSLPTAASGSNMTVGQMLQYAAFLPKQMFFGTSQWAAQGDPRIDQPAAVVAEQKLFFAAAKEAGYEPDAGSDVGWDDPRLILGALRQLPPGADAKQLHDFLVQWKGHAGIDGVYDFVKTPQRGLDVSNAVVVRWDADKKGWHLVSKVAGAPIE